MRRLQRRVVSSWAVVRLRPPVSELVTTRRNAWLPAGSTPAGAARADGGRLVSYKRVRFCEKRRSVLSQLRGTGRALWDFFPYPPPHSGIRNSDRRASVLIDDAMRTVCAYRHLEVLETRSEIA